MNLAEEWEGRVQEAITNIQKKREKYEGENGMPVVPRYNTKKYITFKKECLHKFVTSRVVS